MFKISPTMSKQKTTVELLKEYKETVQLMLPVLNSGDKKELKKLSKSLKVIFNDIKKKDQKLATLLPILRSDENDSLKMVTAQLLFDDHEGESLGVLREITNSKQPMSSTANAIMRQLIERKEKLGRWYKNSQFIVGLIIAVFFLENFSRLFRNIYYGTSVDYLGVALSTGVFIATLWLYRKKIEFGYYYTIFYFALGFQFASQYFFFYFFSKKYSFLEIFTVQHVIVSGFSQILILYVSLAALYLLLKELRLKDFKKISTRNDEEIAAKSKTDEELLWGLLQSFYELRYAINQKDDERANIAIRDRWVCFNELRKRDPKLISLVHYADKVEVDEKLPLAALLLGPNEPEAYRLLNEIMESDSTKSSENWHQANNYIIAWEHGKKARKQEMLRKVWLVAVAFLLFINFVPDSYPSKYSILGVIGLSGFLYFVWHISRKTSSFVK
jgi:hypothetical protein